MSTLNLGIAPESVYDDYVKIFLGLGCFMSWINAATVLGTIETFAVVK